MIHTTTFNRIAACFAVLAGSLSMGTVAQASTVLELDTGVATWTVSEGGAAPTATKNVGFSYLPGVWTDEVDARWIMPKAGLYRPGGINYIFTTEFVVDPGMYQLAGEFSADNIVVDILFNGVSIGGDYPITPNEHDREYLFAHDLDVMTTTPSSLSFVVYNEDFTNPRNPVGLVFDGQLEMVQAPVPVPLPAAAWGGMGLMGLIAVGRKLRRKA